MSAAKREIRSIDVSDVGYRSCSDLERRLDVETTDCGSIHGSPGYLVTDTELFP